MGPWGLNTLIFANFGNSTVDRLDSECNARCFGSTLQYLLFWLLILLHLWRCDAASAEEAQRGGNGTGILGRSLNTTLRRFAANQSMRRAGHFCVWMQGLFGTHQTANAPVHSIYLGRKGIPISFCARGGHMYVQYRSCDPFGK